ncbi:MAG: hypothetical protein PHI24_15085 [Desulfitobacteriaceae bacterium]|nr:hypothetical protein [Desulfitobacteriaceae bacterium]
MNAAVDFMVSVLGSGATKVKFVAGVFGELLQIGLVSSGIMFLTKVLNALRGDIAKKVVTAFIT